MQSSWCQNTLGRLSTSARMRSVDWTTFSFGVSGAIQGWFNWISRCLCPSTKLTSQNYCHHYQQRHQNQNHLSTTEFSIDSRVPMVFYYKGDTFNDQKIASKLLQRAHSAHSLPSVRPAVDPVWKVLRGSPADPLAARRANSSWRHRCEWGTRPHPGIHWPLPIAAPSLPHWEVFWEEISKRYPESNGSSLFSEES